MEEEKEEAPHQDPKKVEPPADPFQLQKKKEEAEAICRQLAD